MEHNVIANRRAVSGDKSLFGQWHHKFTTALGQVGGVREEIVRRLVKEIDRGKELEKVVTGLREEFGDECNKVSGDVWEILIPGHSSREYPYQHKGKSKGKDFQGECCKRGEKMHPAKEYPKAKEAGKLKGKGK